jgi:hypothetical protein
MKQQSTQQEVLLITNSSFAHRQWCKKEDDENINTSPEENIEEACVNGLMKELLPEVFQPTKDAKMFLWQMHPGFSFVQLELGELPIAIQKEYSLDPHSFLPAIKYN